VKLRPSGRGECQNKDHFNEVGLRPLFLLTDAFLV